MRRVLGIVGLALGIGLATTFVATPCHAGPDTAVEDAAKARYSEGVKLYNKKKYEEARAAFLQAIALKKRPAAVMMLAQSALKSGRWMEAVRNFDEFQSLAGEMPQKLKDLVESGRREAKSHLGHLAFDVPDGAEVTVDGEKVDPTKPYDVAAGPHTVVVTHREEKKTIEVEAQAAKTSDVHPSFVPKAIIPADTRTRPTLPPAPSPAEPESPSILAPPATKWPVYTLGAIGIGGLATAAVFGGLAANARHGVEVSQQTILRNAPAGADCSRPASFEDKTAGTGIAKFQETCDTLARQQHFATIHQSVFQTSLIVGLAGFAGAVTWFLVAPKEGAKTEEPAKDGAPSLLLAPWAGPGGGGATVQGRF